MSTDDATAGDSSTAETAPVDLRKSEGSPVVPPTTPVEAPALGPGTAARTEAVADPAVPVGGRRPAARVGTIVWGLVLTVIGAGVIAAASGVQFDVELVAITLLALAGVALLAGSVATSIRRRPSAR
jgi:hypothetical protein